MTDAQHVPTPDAAAVPEPAAAETTQHQVEQVAPASDGTPEVQAETPQAPVTEQHQDDDSQARLAELEAQREQWEQQQREYQQWQQQQAQAAVMRQRQAAEQQYKQKLAAIAKQVTAADSDDEVQQHLDSFVRELAGGIQQASHQQLTQAQQQYQQELENLRTQMRQQLDEIAVPNFADRVLAEYGLDPKFKETLMRAKHPDEMPAIAETIKSIFSQSAPQVQQQVAADMAQQRRSANTDAMGGVSGGPLPQRKPEPMRATSSESLDMLGRILGYKS